MYLNNIQNVPIFPSLLSILLILFSSCILISTFLSIVTKMRDCAEHKILMQIHTISENSHRTVSRSILRYMQIHITKLLPMNFLTKTTTCYSIDTVEQLQKKSHRDGGKPHRKPPKHTHQKEIRKRTTTTAPKYS